MLLLVGSTLWIANHGRSLSLRSSDLEPLNPPRFETDLNSAPGYELQLLPGVGPKSVQDIEEFRQRRGLFQSSEELDEVPGFGEVKIKQLKENVVVRPTRGKESSQ